MKPEHDHNSFTHSCPACGLAPRQVQPLTPWGFEFLTENLAPCACGGAPVLIEGGSPKTYRYYCQSKHSATPCEIETSEWPSMLQAVLHWNNIQIAKGFDARKLHPLNR